MCAHDLWLPDMGDFGNAIARGPAKPSTVQFDAVWQGKGSPQKLLDKENRFVFLHRLAEGLVTFSAITEPGISFHSVMTDTPQQTLFAALGVERNGVYLG